MKVLHIISGDLWGGAESQALTLLTSLATFERLSLAVALMNEGRLAQELRRVGIPIMVLSERELGVLSLFNRLRRQICDWAPDIVHTHREKENVLGALANRMAHGAVCVRTVHGLPEPNVATTSLIKRRVVRFLDKLTATYLQDSIICVSNDLRDRLSNEYPAERLVAIENGIDAASIVRGIEPVAFRSSQPDVRHIGIVGRLERVKRVDLFIEMAAVLLKRQLDFSLRFHVFGDGSLSEQLQKHSRELGVESVITFYGSRSDIPSCIAALDVLVMCSDYEGLPMTALEALAVGTPIVAHATGGLPTVVKEATRGTLVREQLPAEYADAVIKNVRAGRNGPGSIPLPLRFDAKRNAERVIEVYTQLLDRR